MATIGREDGLRQLSERFGERATRSAAVCVRHGLGEAFHPPAPPDLVIFPHSTAEVVEAVRICAEARIPVIAFGAGTSLEGHVAAVRGGVCLDLSQMNRILAIHPQDMDAVVEAGVTRRQLAHALHELGLFFPVDPGADATLGGMAATRASGTTTVRYGGMRENVLSLTAVLADGRVIQTGGRARKTSAGYDLTRLLIGSEGTLAIITELTLRLWPRPEAIAAAVCTFTDVDAAVDAAAETIAAGVPVARIELLDAVQMRACIAFSSLEGFEAAPTLFYEFHGSETGVREQSEVAAELARAHGGSDFRWARQSEERNRLWRARHDAYYAAKALRPGAAAWVSDVCVPISALASCIRETRNDIAQSGIPATILGHVGDGNFHVIFLVKPDDAAEFTAVRALNERLVARAIAARGTCTGEHGIGLGKMASLVRELGEAVDVMRAIKRALDPHGILNPGKIFDFTGCSPG